MSAEDMEYEGKIIVLTDDEGKELELEYLDRIAYKGNSYAVLIPPETDEDDDSDEAADVVILRIEKKENDTESYDVVDDENVLSEVFEIFKERFKEYFDFE